MTQPIAEIITQISEAGAVAGIEFVVFVDGVHETRRRIVVGAERTTMDFEDDAFAFWGGCEAVMRGSVSRVAIPHVGAGIVVRATGWID